jgi:hypothetical protein
VCHVESLVRAAKSCIQLPHPFAVCRSTEQIIVIESVEDGESYRSVAADTPNIGRSTIMSIYKNEDRRAWYLDAEAADGRIDQVLMNATD